MLIRLVYVSKLEPSVDRQQIIDLVAAAAAFNQANGITGVIAFEGLRVCQILEGEEAAVLALFGSIEEDNRHSAIIELDRSEIPARHFGDWGMAERSMADMVTLAFSI